MDASRPQRPAARRRRRAAAGAVAPLVTCLVVLAGWQVAPELGLLPPPEFPPLADVAGASADLAAWGQFRGQFGDTIFHWMMGFVAGSLVGLVLGVPIGLSRTLDLMTSTVIEFLRPIPAVVYLPLLVLIFGAVPKVVVILAALGAFFPLLYQTVYGIRDTDRLALETAVAFGLTNWQRLRLVILPAAAPFVATGLRIGATIALLVAITTEFVAGIEGLGYTLAQSQNEGLYARMYAIVVLIGLLGLLIDRGLTIGERRLLGWHESHRPAQP